jgi:hypothetical protein
MVIWGILLITLPRFVYVHVVFTDLEAFRSFPIPSMHAVARLLPSLSCYKSISCYISRSNHDGGAAWSKFIIASTVSSSQLIKLANIKLAKV